MIDIKSAAVLLTQMSAHDMRNILSMDPVNEKKALGTASVIRALAAEYLARLDGGEKPEEVSEHKIFLAVTLPNHHITIDDLAAIIVEKFIDGANVAATVADAATASEPVGEKSLLDRLEAELSDLSERYVALNNFLNSSGDIEFSTEHRQLLREQHSAMHRYLTILQRRVVLVADRTAEDMRRMRRQDREREFTDAFSMHGPFEQRTTARQSDRPDEEISDDIRCTGQYQGEAPPKFND